jgi:phosphatidylglycerol---prolipoprotein diacylglyceryl transferase
LTIPRVAGILQAVRPVLFYLPLGLPIYSYGVMLGLSLVVGWYITLGLCVKDGMDRELMGRCYVWTAVAAVAGARLLYVFTNIDRFDSIIDVFKVNQGGLVAYGGFLGGLVGSTVFCKLKGIRLLAWADCAVPSLCSGLAITRIGCLMFGCDFGKPWDGPWAIQFPKGAPAWNQQLHDKLITSDAVRSLAVHPTQLYESLNGLILLGMLLLVRKYRKFSGEMFVAFFMGYAPLRYIVETLRADEQRGMIGPLTTSQFIGVCTFVAGAAVLAVLIRRFLQDPQSLRLWENGQAMVAAPAVAGGGPAPAPRGNPNAEKRRRKKR